MSDSGTGEKFSFQKETCTNVNGTNNSGDNRHIAADSHNDDNQTPLTATAQKADKHKMQKSHRFQIISKSGSHKWELTGELAHYIIHQFECFIPREDVEENLLILQPVPENVRGVKKLDGFVKSIMGHSAQILNQDATLKKF